MDDKIKKCNQYEGYFVFQDETKFKQHLIECLDCSSEHEKYQKVSSLIKEVAPIYLESEQKNKMMRSAKRLACCLLVFIGITGFTGYKWYDNYLYQVSINQESMVYDMGLPTDEYGFLSL